MRLLPICTTFALMITATTALAVETCDMDQRVLTADGVSGKIIGGPVADMCMVATVDGNMAPIRMNTLTIDTSEPPPTDVRSITPGDYECRTQMSGSNDVNFVVTILDDSRYAIPGEGDGAWSAYDDLSVQFMDGPLAGRFSDAQNSMMMFSRVKDGDSYICKKPTKG